MENKWIIEIRKEIRVHSWRLTNEYTVWGDLLNRHIAALPDIGM
jgi:hypothetical protein